MKKTEEKVINFITRKELINKNDKILVALSGGPDSIFLLYFLSKFKRKFKITLGAFHLNHKLRGKEADNDEEFCKKFCQNLHVEYFSLKKNVKNFAKKNKISFEEAGRIIRYRELSNFQKKYNFTSIATAHNSNDNSETVLLNLIKGTGIKGIAGIPVKRDNIIRPILPIKKEEILEYLNYYKIDYRNDASNLQNNYERNFLRNKIIPLIKEKLNPSFEDTLFNSSEIFKEKVQLIDKITKSNLAEVTKFSKNLLEFDLNKLKLIDKELIGDIFKESIERNFSVQITFIDFQKFDDLLNKESGKKIKLTNGLTGYKERDKVFITFPIKKNAFEQIVIHEGEEKKINSKTISIKKVPSSSVNFNINKNIEYISAENLSKNFILRRWKQGDKFFPLGLKGSKKISDYLNDLKINSFQKENQLILTNRNRIIWVVGLRIDERFKLSENSRKVLQLCLK